MTKKTKWNKAEIERARLERDKEIRRLCDEIRSRGETPNYAQIGRQYELTRERIRQIDEDR